MLEQDISKIAFIKKIIKISFFLCKNTFQLGMIISFFGTGKGIHTIVNKYIMLTLILLFIVFGGEGRVKYTMSLSKVIFFF